jgi:hypothetical protein
MQDYADLRGIQANLSKGYLVNIIYLPGLHHRNGLINVIFF